MTIEQYKDMTNLYFKDEFRVRFMLDFKREHSDDEWVKLMESCYGYLQGEPNEDRIKNQIQMHLTRSNLLRKKPKEFYHYMESGHLDKYMPSRKKAYTEEKIREIAKKCKGKSDFAKKNQSAYKAASRLGILNTLIFIDYDEEMSRLNNGISQSKAFEIIAPFIDDDIVNKWNALFKPSEGF
jgi:hypothetical protein